MKTKYEVIGVDDTIEFGVCPGDDKSANVNSFFVPAQKEGQWQYQRCSSVLQRPLRNKLQATERYNKSSSWCLFRSTRRKTGEPTSVIMQSYSMILTLDRIRREGESL